MQNKIADFSSMVFFKNSLTDMVRSETCSDLIGRLISSWVVKRCPHKKLVISRRQSLSITGLKFAHNRLPSEIPGILWRELKILTSNQNGWPPGSFLKHGSPLVIKLATGCHVAKCTHLKQTLVAEVSPKSEPPWKRRNYPKNVLFGWRFLDTFLLVSSW